MRLFYAVILCVIYYIYMEGVIYKIYFISDPSLFYIGSTCNLKRRICNHKSNSVNNIHHNALYKVIRNTGGWKNWKVDVVEKYVCASRIDLYIRERYYIDYLSPSLNHSRPCLTDDDRLKYSVKYRENHREYYRNYMKKYSKEKIICRCGSNFARSSKTNHLKSKKHKDFIQKNKK